MPRVSTEGAGAHLVIEPPKHAQLIPLDEGELRRLITQCQVALVDIGCELEPTVADLVSSFNRDPREPRDGEPFNPGLLEVVEEEIARAIIGDGAKNLHHRDTQAVQHAAREVIDELHVFLKKDWIDTRATVE